MKIDRQMTELLNVHEKGPPKFDLWPTLGSFDGISKNAEEPHV
jgi:hypothetical protein